MTTDLELLRAYEPIIRYTNGELFFPAAVEPYLAECDLLVGSKEGHARLLVSSGGVDAAMLATQTAPPGETLYLRLVQHPLGGLALSQWQRRPGHPVFRAPGRLARVGLFARLLDAAFNASLLLRGKVPGGTAAAASVKYEAARAQDPRYVYHGRVVRRGGWIVLHYLYFYFMNDWRSTFAGANDHEADLEQAFVVLEDAPGGPRPVWFGCAAHDYSGDELRRRWDDPYITLVGDHPVIHAGAGSHAAYFEAGEYITTVPVPAFRGVASFFDVIRHVWRDTLRQGDPGDLGARVAAALSIPFIDTPAATGWRSGPGRRPNGRSSPSMTRSPGSTAIGGCGASTRATGSPESAPQPASSTPGPARFAHRGMTLSGSSGWTRSRRHIGRSRRSTPGSLCSPRNAQASMQTSPPRPMGSPVNSRK